MPLNSSVTRRLSVAIVSFCAALAPQRVPAASRWNEMDYGAFLTSSVSMHPPKDVETTKGVTVKAISVKVGSNATYCFDTNLLRPAGGWTGGWLKLMGTPFDGTHRPPEGSRPAPAGTYVFESATDCPGWAKPGTDDFSDPRSEPFLPLPRDWSHYSGLYVHDDHVVFSYTVGTCAVLDCPWYDSHDAGGQFTRTISMAASAVPLTMLVCDASTPDTQLQVKNDADALVAGLGSVTVAAVGQTSGASWQQIGSHLVYRIPAHDATLKFKIVIAAGPAAAFKVDKSVVDVEAFTHGGSPRYSEEVETKGKLGVGDGPYVVDTLALPDNNPWHSWMRIGGFDFFKDGKRAAVCTWSGDVWTVRGVDDKLDHLIWKRIAAGLFQPLGLKIVDDQIYVLGRDQVTILHDLNGDGEADFYENFNNDISVTPNFHEFVFDLQQAPDGSFFFEKGAPLLGTQYFDPIGKHNGCVLHLPKDGSKLEIFATGLRAPNGGSVGPHGEVTCSDNQGIWTPVDRINLVREGNFLGCVGTAHRMPAPTTYDPPLCWIPYPDPDNSGGGQAWVPDNRWGPWAGSMVFLSYGKCSLFHVVYETVDGTPQGGIIKLPVNFETGSMRARFNLADGQLYVAGLKGWQTNAGHDGALQRVRYTQKTVRDVTALHVTPTGLQITFTVPLDRASATDVQNYNIEQYDYRWTEAYGSDVYKVSDPKTKGRDNVDIKSASLSPDGKTVTLELAKVQPVMQMITSIKVDSADKTPIDLQIDHTINRMPGPAGH